jgi:hypothetical protein
MTPFDWLIGGPTALTPGGGPYDPTFQSGDIQYVGPNGTLAGSGDLEFGQNIPTPSGVNGPFLLLGSGYGPGGSGTPRVFWIGTDEAYDANTPGNFLGITAGETQPSGTASGGELFIIGGASFGGMGGLLQLQGGTSYNGNGGEAVIQGGNATNGGIPGDAFVEGGVVGSQGANVHLIPTTLNNISGVIRHRWNSAIVWDEFVSGAWYFYNGGGYGLAGQPLVSGGPGQPVSWAANGFTGTVVTAKLTGGGTEGSMTFYAGLLTGQVQAT